MTTITEIEDSVAGWLASVAAASIQHKTDDHPYVKGASIDIYTTAVMLDQWGKHEQSSGGIVHTETRQARVTIRLESYGSGAISLLTRAVMSLSATGRFRDIWKLVGQGRVGQIRDLSSLEFGSTKGRAEVEIEFHTALVETFTRDYFNAILLRVVERDKGLVLEINGGDNPHPIPEGCNNV